MKNIITAIYHYREDAAEYGARFMDDIECVDVTYEDGTEERFSGAEEIALIGNIIFQQQRRSHNA